MPPSSPPTSPRRALPLAGQPAAPPASASRSALLAKGFRPFFLLASAHAALFVPAWVAVFGGSLGGATGSWPAPLWHAHEMIGGFALAVVAGFVLTAVENWTKRVTARGAALAALALLWLLGRAAFFAGTARGWPALAALDALFPLALAVAIGRPLWAARNRRNALFPLALLAFAAAEATLHAAMGSAGGAARARAALGAALDVVLLFVALVTGRIVPLFTRNATGAGWIEDGKPVGRVGVALLAAAAAAGWAEAPAPLQAALLVAATALLGWRARRWGLRPSLREPLLWVLHVGHLWLLLALALRVGWLLAPEAVPRSAWLHAAGSGAIGVLTLGMMARVALGHTGRPLRTIRPMGAAFLLLNLAATLRLAAALWPSASWPLLLAAMGAWSAAFGAYLLRYAPILWRPRADGRPG